MTIQPSNKSARPSITSAMVLEAAEMAAKDLVSDAEPIKEHYYTGISGYELAKKLEEYEYWDIDLMVIERLDYVDDDVREIHRKACWQWVNDNNITPPLPIGSRIERGFITGISEHSPAC